MLKKINMSDKTTIFYDKERSPHEQSIYLPHKHGTKDILYIDRNDPPLDLSGRSRRIEGELHKVPAKSRITADYASSYSDSVSSDSVTARGVIRKPTPAGASSLSSPVKLYKCSECDYVSKRSYDVRRHMKTHGYSRSYGCPQCAHTARDSASLRTHMLKKHGNLDQYVCPRCDFSSNRQAELARHIRVFHERR